MIDTPNIRELLNKALLFQGIPSKFLTPIIKQAIQISLKQGEQLLSPGVINEHVYIILSGQMSVHVTLSLFDEPIAILNPGECVGEMSVLVDSVVSAYVIAKTDCQLLAIGYSSFWSLIKGSNESARNMLNILVQRIRSGNEALAITQLHIDKFPGKNAHVDSLTGLYNDHGIQEIYERLLQQSTPDNQPLCLILLKADEVKSTYGIDSEISNNQPLHVIAQTILTLLRPNDHAAHLNGNTFAILLTNLKFSDACTTAEQLRAAVSKIPLRLPDGSSLPPVTISAGIGKVSEDDIWSVLTAKVYRALERAIQAGGNLISD